MWGHEKFLITVSYNSFFSNSKKGLHLKHDNYASEQTEVASIIYNLEKFSKVFFTYLYSLLFFYIMYIFWTHLFRIIINVHREVDKAFVSSGYLKSQSFFILIPDGGIRPAPLNFISPLKNSNPFCLDRAGCFLYFSRH